MQAGLVEENSWIMTYIYIYEGEGVNFYDLQGVCILIYIIQTEIIEVTISCFYALSNHGCKFKHI